MNKHTVLKRLFAIGLYLGIASSSIATIQMTKDAIKFPDGSEQTTANFDNRYPLNTFTHDLVFGQRDQVNRGNSGSSRAMVKLNGTLVVNYANDFGETDIHGTVVRANGKELATKEYVNSASGGVPSGTIVMWSGSNVPPGWAICNGSNGTPNLTGKFIKAATTAGSTGGSNTHSHGHTLQGGAHTLTTAQMPSHNHSKSVHYGREVQDPYYGGQTMETGYNLPSVGGRFGSLIPGTSGGTHTAQVASQGGNATHSHPVSGSINSGSNQPEYYSLLFIMKL